ncbi:bactofilin family protein [Candidatus Palauibacter sp.]|uniref:bactofilin family protein n=1 Tax=Candidatus Palauibacter sp. TaxID=3101350 RepID=UPI003B59C219
MVGESRGGAHGRDPNEDVSLIGPGMEILGGINCEGAVRVQGKVGGPVRTSAPVVVGKGGRIDGDVEAVEVVVGGTVKGSIVGARRVELRETGRIKGDIQTERMRVDEGAQFEGYLRLGKAPSDVATGSPTLAKTRRSETKPSPKK